MLVAAVAVLVVGFVPIAVIGLYEPLRDSPAGLAIPLYFATPVGAFVLWRRWWRERRGFVHVDERGLYLDDERILPRAAVHDAQVPLRDGTHFVRLGRRTRQVEVGIAGDADAAAGVAGLLRVMGLDAE